MKRADFDIELVVSERTGVQTNGESLQTGIQSIWMNQEIGMNRATDRKLLYLALATITITPLGMMMTGTMRNASSTSVSINNKWQSVPLSIRIEPFTGAPLSQDQLRRVALAVVPRWKVGKVPSILHALRLWGPQSTFSDDRFIHPNRLGILSGDQMVQILLDDRKLHKSLVPCESILYWKPDGIEVQYGHNSTPAHCDQLLKVLAEIGLPANTPVSTFGEHQGTINDIIKGSLRDFLIDQELEFTAVAYSRWLPPVKSWTNRFEETCSFDNLADALLKKPLGKGACYGIHVPYALVNLLRANEQHSVVSSATAKSIENRLVEISRLLESHQDESGAWFGDWTTAPVSGTSSQNSFEIITATGHHLEWVALAPNRLRPSEQSVAKAARLLARLIPEHDSITISNPRSYGPFSHAARALMLLHNVNPERIIQTELTINAPDMK
jgi:hypothetical protein